MNRPDRLVKPKASVSVSEHVSTVIKHVEKQNGCCLDGSGSLTGVCENSSAPAEMPETMTALM